MDAPETILFFSAIFASALFSGAETGLYCLNRIRLRFRAQQGDRSAVRLQYLLRDTRETIIAVLIGTNVAHFAVTAIFTRFLGRSGFHSPQIASTLILAPLLFVFAETLPKNIFQQKADMLTYRVEPILTALRYLFYPFVIVLSGITSLVALAFSRKGQPADTLLTRQGLHFFFRETHGTLTPYLGQITENIMSLHRITLADVMIPLARAVTVDASIGNEALEQVMRQARFSRLPVYEGSPGNLVGILNCFDYLYEERRREGIRHLVRPVIHLERSTPIHVALHRMQAGRNLMAIVTDARGRAVGIVTLKDLVEEIVGELAEAG
jgi:putative hemolysin